MKLSKERKMIFAQKLRGIMSDYDKSKANIDLEVKSYSSKINNLPEFIEAVDNAFEIQTGITKKDMSFLVFASTLQVARQLLTSIFKVRLSDEKAASQTPFHNDEEHSNRLSKKYYATEAEILSNPVPFDAMRKSDVIKRNGNPKLNGFNHRYIAIGHDPILGLIFGTANIMTKTITISKGGFQVETYHVETGVGSNGYGMYPIDILSNQASTYLMFEHIRSRLEKEGKRGWNIMAISLGKELVHLLSDLRTAKSLPIPMVSAHSPELSRVLNLCGIDFLSTTTFSIDYFVSKLIDFIISYLHMMCYDADADGPIDTYQVRTKNIIYYSNLISIISTTIQTLFRAYMGDVDAMAKFDFGGSMASLQVIWKSPFIISEMKSEFIRSKTSEYLSK